MTALPNRLHFRREAERILAGLGPGAGAALLFIDLDGFKEVNDRLGHAQGDQVLVMVANRLRVVLKAEVAPGSMAQPILARLAGDEFTMLLPDVGGREEAERIAGRAIAALAEPFSPAGQPTLLGASIGVALAPEHGVDLTALMKAADTAMYHAKASGRSRLCTFEPRLARASEQRLEAEASLRRAVQDGELALVYEPQICLRSGAVTAAEALVRWRGDGTVRLLSPADGLLEETGLCSRVGEWTLDEVAAALGRWRGAALPHRLCFAVPLRQFERLDFAGRLRGVLARSGPPPWRVEIEVGEGAAAGCDKWLAAELEVLRREGVGISVCGLGAGNVALSRLAGFPADRMRLDPAMVADIDRCERARSVAASLIHLIHGLGCEAVAVGVERQDQVEVLRALGCDTLQGLLSTGPMEEEDFLRWAKAQGSVRALARAS